MRAEIVSPGMVTLFVLAGVLTALFAIPFSAIPWPYGDVYTVLEKAQLPWHDALLDAFARGVEYRPLFTLLVKLLYEGVGLHLWVYKAIVLVQFAAILAVFVVILRPENPRRTFAAFLAVAVVVGLHTTRILFSFFPVNHHSLVILLVLAAAAIALSPRWRHADWVLPVLTLTGLLFIEFGLLTPVVLTALAIARAPNATRRSVLGAWIALVVYAAVRFSFTTQTGFPFAHAETGIGFEIVAQDDLKRIFAHAPWLLWAYNITATFLTVMISEPRSGIYYFVKRILRGSTTDWLWLHVLSSAATTAVIVWALARRRMESPHDRQLVALGATLVLCGSALGFLYARDRIGLPVGLGYAVLLYVAVSRSLERPPANILAKGLLAAVIVALIGAWGIRDLEAWFQVRDTAWERHVEWSERFVKMGGLNREQTPLLARLRAEALARQVNDPRLDPPWMYKWFERRVDARRD